MTEPRHAAFFGYGSLVNRATHDYAPGEPARLCGWRRVWRHTRLRPFAYLSAEPADAEMDGLVAAVPGNDWAGLDEREAAYRRCALHTTDLRSRPAWAIRIEIYAVDEAHADMTAQHPILLSYLDTVVQGFLREFGETGADRFFATTAGWSTIRDDRAAPLYPRHQPLSRAERRRVDDHLAALGISRDA
ncbi:MAG: gamma-glutamylcyclotransferase family protein [Paracoccaceae bacterium]